MYKFFSLFVIFILSSLNIFSNNNFVQLTEALRALQQATPKKISSKPPIDLTWCPCISKEVRMDYAKQLAQDIARTFKPKQFTKDNPFIYASIGSGGLLQDYRNLKKIIQDHKFYHIHVFIVDVIYPTACKDFKCHNTADYIRYVQLWNDNRIKKYNELANKTTRTSAEYSEFTALQNNREFSPLLKEYVTLQNVFITAEEQIPIFRGLLESILPPNTLTITHFTTPEHYIAYVASNEWLKPHCISFVDPDLKIFYATKFPNEANILFIEDLKNTRSPALYYAKPYNQRGQFWSVFNRVPHDTPVPEPYFFNNIKYNANDSIQDLMKHFNTFKSYKLLLFTSPYLTIQYVIGNVKRDTTLFYRLQKVPVYPYATIETPYKVTDIDAFLRSDQVKPYLAKQAEGEPTTRFKTIAHLEGP